MAISHNHALAVSVEVAAQMMNVSRSLAWNLVWEGKLRSVKLGRRRLVPLEAISELLGGSLDDVRLND